MVFALQAGESQPLGNTGNISAVSKKIASKYTYLSHAQKLLSKANVLSKRSGKPHATRYCHAHRAYGADAITIRLRGTGESTVASYGGLQTCGSIWACPVCASRVAHEKAELVLKSLEWAKQENLLPAMIAITASHNKKMRLQAFKDDFKASWEMFSSHWRWKKFKKKYGIKHHIANREITRGVNGWHYHMHLLLFLDFDATKSSDETSLQSDLETLWLECLDAHGLQGKKGVALNVSAHKNVGETYLTKIGITISEKDGKLEYEMTSTENKGKSVWDILRWSYDGDEEAGELYIEFVEAMSDTNFMTFSHGLMKLIEDIELPKPEIIEENVSMEWAEISPYWWLVVRRAGAMGQLLALASVTRDIDHLRGFVWSLMDELKDAGELPAYDGGSDEFSEGIRIIS